MLVDRDVFVNRNSVELFVNHDSCLPQIDPIIKKVANNSHLTVVITMSSYQ